MQEWRLEESAFKEFYYPISQHGPKFYRTKETHTNYKISRRINNYPDPWEKMEPSVATKCKKDIIVSNFILAAEPKGGHESYTVVYELLRRGFSLYVLTKKGQLEKIDNDKRNDLAYLKALFAKSELFRKEVMRQKLAERQKEGSLFPISLSHETTVILDHCQTEKFIHACVPTPDMSEPKPFDYKIPIQPKFLDVATLEQQVPLDQGRLIIDNYSKQILKTQLPLRVKKINLAFGLCNNKPLSEVISKDVEELELKNYNLETLDLSCFPHLKVLILYDSQIVNLKNLPPGLERLDLLSLGNLTELPDWSNHQQLRKIKIRNCALKTISKFPPNVTEIDLFHKGNIPPLADYPLLENLKLDDMDEKKIAALNLDQCKSLKKLCLGRTIFSEAKRYEGNFNWPPALQKLTIEHRVGDIKLPNSLKELHLAEYQGENKLSLPPNLLKAHLVSVNPFPFSIDVSQAPNLEFLNAQSATNTNVYLPNLERLTKLQTLISPSSTLHHSDDKPLPHNLRRLEVQQTYYDLRHLPLQTLALGSRMPDGKAKLPLNLQSLTLIGDEFTDLAKDIDFPEGPANLQHLGLSKTKITSLDMRQYSELRVIDLRKNKINTLQPPNGLMTIDTVINLENAVKEINPQPPIISLKRDSWSDKEKKHSHPAESNPIVHAEMTTPRSGLSKDTYTDPDTPKTVPYHIFSAQEGVLRSIDPCHYRQEVYNQIESYELCPKALINKKLIELAEYKIIKRHESYKPNEMRFMAENERYVKWRIKVSGDGVHYIPLPTLTAQDQMNDMVMPADSRLLYDAELNRYLLEWTTTKEEDALLEYRFLQGEGPKFSPKTSPAPLPLDSKLTEKLQELFSAESTPENALPTFVQFKKALLAAQKKDFAARLAFCNQELAAYCKEFRNIGLINKLPGGEKLQEILVERKGSCLDRSSIYVLLCHFLKVPARQIYNPIHSFVELFINGQWQIKQLSGADVNVLNRNVTLELKDEESSKSFASTDEKARMTDEKTGMTGKGWQNYFAPHCSNQSSSNLAEVFTRINQARHPTITMANHSQGRDFYAAYAKHIAEQKTPREVVYLESAEDFHDLWRLCHIDDNGRDHWVDGPLRRILHKGGTVITNWGMFSPKQMATLKTMMDTPPTLFGEKITAPVNFVHLTTPQTEACSAFFSRTEAFEWPATVNWPAPYRFLSSQASAETAEEEKRVEQKDLYNHPGYWESSLRGEILSENKGLRFEPGTLTRIVSPVRSVDPSRPVHPEEAQSAVSKDAPQNISKDSQVGERGLAPKCLELIDPPQEDSRFQAFMARMSVERAFWTNGQKIELPQEFTWRSRPAPARTAENKLITPLTVDQWLADPQDNEYLLDSNRIEALSRQWLLKPSSSDSLPEEEGSRMTITSAPGYMQQKSQTPKRLVQIGPLSAGDRRRIEDAITEKVEWLDLTSSAAKQPLNLASIEGLRAHVFDPKTRGILIQTSDPDFVAQQLVKEQKNTLTVAIDANTRASALLEYINTPKDEKASAQDLIYKAQGVLQALKEGKTIVLYGELSQDLYDAVQSLLTARPQFKLSTEESACAFPGRLVALTKTAPKNSALVQHSRTQVHLPASALWSAYKTQLGSMAQETKLSQPYDLDDFEKLKIFYELAEKSPPYRGESVVPYFSYTRLKSFLTAVKEPKNDNPIKSWFHHDFDHDTSSYAYLNVMAKLLFGPQQAPGVRQTKLAKLPSNASLWQKLNCLNPAALRQVFWGSDTIPDAKQCLTLNDMAPAGLQKRLEEWLAQPKNYEELQPNAKPYAKALAKMREHLQKENVIVLKGPPGVGKTYAAKRYAKEVGSDSYAADDPIQIKKWLDAKPKDGEKAVLRVDDAQDGNWEFLKPLISQPITPQHQVIFTCNASPVMQSVLQNAPTVYVNQWSLEELRTEVAQPLCQKIAKESKTLSAQQDQASSLHDDIVDDLLAMYLWVKQEYGKEQVSLCDLKQVLMRWLLNPAKDRQAAFNACWQEWGHFFEQEAACKEFKQQLNQRFPGCVIDYQHHDKIQPLNVIPAGKQESSPQEAKLSHPGGLDPGFLPGRHEGFCPLPEQKDIMALVAADMKLAEEAHAKLQDEDDPSVKWGVLVQGDSGFGKSEIMRRRLKWKREISALELTRAKGNCEDCFVQFTPCGDVIKDEEVFLVAYEKGCVVIADELNLHYIPSLKTLMTEKVVIANELNLLYSLETHTTEKVYRRVKMNPHFFVCATQNDPNMSGRTDLPDDLLNRFHLLHTPRYSAANLLTVVRQTLPELASHAEAIVQAYLTMAQQHASVNLRRFFIGLKTIREKMPQILKMLAEIIVPTESKDLRKDAKSNVSASMTTPPIPNLSQFFQPPPNKESRVIPIESAIPGIFGLASLTAVGVTITAALQPSGAVFPNYSHFAAEHTFEAYAIAGTMMLLALTSFVVSYQNFSKSPLPLAGEGARRAGEGVADGFFLD